MDDFTCDKRQLDEILGKLREGDLTDADIEVLNVLLESDARLRDRYASGMLLFTELRRHQGSWDGGALTSGDRFGEVLDAGESVEAEAREGAGEGLIFYRLSRYAIAGLIVLCVLLSIALSAAINRGGDEGKGKLPKKNLAVRVDAIDQVDAVAVITRMVNAEWEAGSDGFVSGSLLEPCILRLKSGLIQIEFYSGATCIVEGPAVFEIKSDNHGTCHRGKVRSYVPDVAHGFVVDSAEAKVVDLGTEFGIRVDGDGVSEIQVFDGSVEVHGVQAGEFGEMKLLRVGEGMQVSRDGSHHRIGIDESAFVSPAELARISTRRIARREMLWRDHMTQLREDPALVLLYTFETDEPWRRSVSNLSDQKGKANDGVIVGCRWVTGRWPGKSGLKFHRSSSDRIRANIPGVFKQVTFSTWVKIEGLDRPFNALILTKHWGGRSGNKVHWQLLRNGSTEFSTLKGGRVVSPVLLRKKDFGKWVMLSVSFDSDRDEVKHYVNGGLVSRQILKGSLPVKMGLCDIGNWSSGYPQKSRRFLHGSMDEFLVMRRVMSEKEIGALYKAGRNEH